ncbi:MAG: nuclear transport factor 2 family protein [Actinobacteria bacterium]|uniref:Unannotated protein n=1 Tax=freshwater metagenome TaxID=449393 RepID=A0A6J7F993_9ZZZZ|nr:nuclear transport factor 2 family protein [Actinomycetota bacterium]
MSDAPHSPIEALLAKDAITAIIHRVARGTDRLDHELIVSGYWPDGFDDHNSFRGGPVEFADWVLQVLPHFAATHHFLGQCSIDLALDDASAYVETYCSAHHVGKPDADGRQADMRMGLRYCDHFQRRAGEWRIARRVCAFDWAYWIEPATPWEFPNDFTVGHRSPDDISYRLRKQQRWS